MTSTCLSDWSVSNSPVTVSWTTQTWPKTSQVKTHGHFHAFVCWELHLREGRSSVCSTWNEKQLPGAFFAFEVASPLTSHSFVPVSFPRILEGQITWPRGGYSPWCHCLYSNGCQEGFVSSQRCTAQLCKGEDFGQESKSCFLNPGQ